MDDGRSTPAETPDGHGFIALLKAFRRSGGTVPSGIFGALFAQRQCAGAPRLQTLIERGEVLAFEWRADLWIPLFQFDADDFSIKASAREVRAELPVCWSAWRVATWFVQPQSCLGDCSPVDVLDQGKADVIRAAQSVPTKRRRIPVPEA
jgi:hypothetical protein